MEEQNKEGPKVKFSFGQKAVVFAPTAAAVCGLDMVLHAPLPLAIAGLVGAYYLARSSPEIYGAIRQHTPLLQAGDKERHHGEWTVTDRLLGKHLRVPASVSRTTTGQESGDAIQRADRHSVSDESVWQESSYVGMRVESDELIRPRTAGDVFLFSSLLERFAPTGQRIFLAHTLDGRDLFCKVEELCHVALAGSTGQGKCLEENEPVFLADGRIVPAKSLRGESAQVVGMTDMQTMQQVPVTASFTDNGVRTVIEIELDNSIVLKRTEEHPLWAAQLDDRQYGGLWDVPADGRRRRAPRTRAINEGWVQAKDLRVCGNRPNFAGHVLLCPTAIHQQGTVSRPDADVILCAALLAEGGLTQRYSVHFTNADPLMIEAVAAEEYDCVLTPNSRHSKPAMQFRIVKASRHKGSGPINPVFQLVRDWKIAGCNATEKTIPNWVFQLPDEQIALFLRVFIDCVGWFGANRHPSVCVALANAPLIQQIGQLALRLGIAGTYRQRENGHAGAWIWSSPMVDVWQERIGSTVKAEALARAVQEKRQRESGAATDGYAWRQARPTTGQTFADCPEGYEWRKIVAIRRMVAPTVSIEVHTRNHAFVGYAVEHNTSLMRMLLLQLCKARMQVLLLNPHYTRYDIENDEDWTPFEPYLAHPPMECRSYAVIEHFLKMVAKDLIPKRLERRAQSRPLGKPYFIAIDELPSIVREIKAAPEYMRIILEEGRKVGVFLISAAQDFLVKTISPSGGGGSIRECYRTAYYVGGDPTTARVLLDMPANLIPEDQLGKGVVMLRGAASKKATQVFVPYVDNASLYRLLGPSTSKPSLASQTQERSRHGIDMQQPESRARTPGPSRDMIIETIVALNASGKLDDSTLTKLIEQLPIVTTDDEDETDEGALPPQILADARGAHYLREVHREEVEESPVVPVKAQSRHQEKFAAYIAVWQDLSERQCATLRDFAKATGLNEAKAYKILDQMEEAHLIHWERRKRKRARVG